MPVSEPSYFPPQRSVDRIIGLNCGTQQLGERVLFAGQGTGNYTGSGVSDVIFIGNAVLSTGTVGDPITDDNAQYSVIIGSQAGRQAQSFTDSILDSAGPSVIVGGNSLTEFAALPNNVAVGANILPSLSLENSCSDNVFVGGGILSDISTGSVYQNVIVGSRVLDQPITGGNEIQGSVVLGFHAIDTVSSSVSVKNDVIIGANACPIFTGTNSVYIGYGVGPNSNGITGNVVIGYEADALISNSVAIGTGAVTSGADTVLIGANSSAAENSVVIGESASATNVNNCILIGQGSTATIAQSVIIGQGINSAATDNPNILIGQGFSPETSGNLIVLGSASALASGCDDLTAMGMSLYVINSSQCVVLGNTAQANTASDAVVIGYAAQGANGAFQAVAVGWTAIANAAYSTVIGASSVGDDAGGSSTVIGSYATATGANTVIVGSSVAEAAGSSGSQVIIGCNFTAVDTTVGAVSIAGNGVQTFFSYPNGNTLLGNPSSTPSNAPFPTDALNILMLSDGTVGSADPVGGGYFYSSDGQLHWVDEAGNNTTLSVSAGGQLAASVGTAYTNGAGADAGTIGNAPAAGNPTKWIPINDNGTIRHIPAW